MHSALDSGYACRACGAILSEAADWKSCPRCAHINVMPQKEKKFPLGHLGVSLPNGDHAVACAVLHDATERQLSRARKLIKENVPAATAFLLGSIREREARLDAAVVSRSNVDDGDGVLFNLGTQLLYLLLCELGDVRLALTSASPVRSPLYTSLWPILGDIPFLVRLRNAAAAGLSSYAIDAGTLIETQTESHRLVLETQTNSRRVERLFRSIHDPLDEPELCAAQEAVLGFSMRDWIPLMARNFARLGEKTILINQGGVITVQLDGAGEPARSILDAMTLTLDRVRRFATPFYFDIGLPRDEPIPIGLPHDVIGQNWTAYYPCYSAISENGHARVAVFSKHVLVNALSYMVASRSQLMAQLVRHVGNDASPMADDVRRHARALSARLEQRIAEQLRRAGFKAESSVVKLSGVQLSCGEIDVLGVRARKSMTEIVVVEAKDLDFPLQKLGALDRASETLLRGAEQLEKRITWIKEHWRDVVQALGVKPSSSAAVTPLLVTRRYMLPDTIATTPVVPYNMLPSLLQRLATGNFAPKDGLAALPRISLTPGS